MRRHLGILFDLALAATNLAADMSQDQSAIDELKKSAVSSHASAPYMSARWIV